MRVVAGNANRDREERLQVREVERIIPIGWHTLSRGRYWRNFLRYYDIALIELKSPFDTTDGNIRKIDYLANSTCSDGSRMEMSGWGSNGSSWIDQRNRTRLVLHCS